MSGVSLSSVPWTIDVGGVVELTCWVGEYAAKVARPWSVLPNHASRVTSSAGDHSRGASDPASPFAQPLVAVSAMRCPPAKRAVPGQASRESEIVRVLAHPSKRDAHVVERLDWRHVFTS